MLTRVLGDQYYTDLANDYPSFLQSNPNSSSAFYHCNYCGLLLGSLCFIV